MALTSTERSRKRRATMQRNHATATVNATVECNDATVVLTLTLDRALYDRMQSDCAGSMPLPQWTECVLAEHYGLLEAEEPVSKPLSPPIPKNKPTMHRPEDEPKYCRHGLLVHAGCSR